MRILVSGMSGPIGLELQPSLEADGATIVRLKRASTASAGKDSVVSWRPDRPLDPQTVSGFDAVIHLAGETIVGRWTDAKKKAIRDSRVLGTRHLAQALAQTPSKPRVFICSSAIGYYGDRGDEIVNEASAPGTGFLPEVCIEWEAAAKAAAESGIRTAHIRTGIVLSPKGGALGQMLTPFKLGLGGRVGSGRQWMSWIDVQDMVGGILHVLRNDRIHGPVNFVAPAPVTNQEFTKTLASVLHRPAVFPVPSTAIKLLFGEMGTTLLLGSTHVEPAQLKASGYAFRFPDLRTSLVHILTS